MNQDTNTANAATEQNDGHSNGSAPLSERAGRAAWDVGRLLNHLRFLRGQMHFLRDNELTVQAQSVSNDLHLAVGDLCPNIQTSDRLRKEVDDTMIGFISYLDTEDYGEKICAVNFEMARYMDNEQYGLYSPIEAEMEFNKRCKEVTDEFGPHGDLGSSTLYFAIESYLNDYQKEVLQLAKQVDQILHPFDIYNQMHEDTPRETQPSSSQLEWLLPNKRFPEPVPPPTIRTIRLIHQNWERFKWSVDSCPLSLKGYGPSGSQSLEDSEQRLSCGPDQMEEVIREVGKAAKRNISNDLAADSADSDLANEGYLAIRLGDRTARRKDKQVEFGRKEKAWQLFKRVCEGGSNGVERNAIFSDLWEVGQDPTNFDKTKESANEILRPLDIKIGKPDSNQRGGWALVEITSPSS